MKKLFFILLLFGIIVEVQAQTNVSGLISSNTTWNITGSPYIVTGNVLVQQSVNLTIEQGVEVKFDAGKAIQIDGELIAIGSPTNRIIFTSNTTSTNGAWLKIQFDDTSIDGVEDTNGNYISGSALQYCDILYGGGFSTGTGAININSANPFISNCNILNSGGDGIHVYGSAPNFTFCNIRNCDGKGIYFELIYHFDCVLKIENDSIENNVMGGIFFEYGNGTCSNPIEYIRNNYFYNNTQHGAIWVEYGIILAHISQNHFLNNVSTQGGAIRLRGWNNTVQCNLFENNQASQGGAIYSFNPDFADDTYVQNNIFQNNQATEGGAIFFDYIVANLSPCNVTFTNNIVRNNSAGTAVFIKGNMGNGIGNITSTFHILQNEFHDNQTSSTLRLFYFLGNISNNNFDNPNAIYEIYNDNTSGAPNVSADSNYWGTTSVQHIDSVIYDFFDNASQTYVSYNPVLPSAISADTSCIPLPTGIHSIANAHVQTIVFPNPFSVNVEIDFERELKDASFYLYNVYGQRLKTMQKINGKQIKILRENICNGIYIYEVIEKQKRISNGKLVIE